MVEPVISPLVSVVIPTRNRRQLLEFTLATVLAQQAVQLEAIVVDEASDDGTADMLAAHSDPRVRHVRHNRPLGVAAARNRGLAEARGEWVGLLDDDDLWAPDKLAVQLRVAEGQGAPWVCSGAVAVDGALRVVEVYRPPDPARLRDRSQSARWRNAGSSNVLVRTALVREVGGLDPALRHLADWDLWRKLAAAAAPAVVDAPAVAYRLHRGNASLGTPGIVEEAHVIAARSPEPIDWGAIHNWMAVNHLRGGRRRAAAAAYLRAAAGGHRRSALRALNALVVPGAGRRLTFHPLRRDGSVRDVDWQRRAEAWLDELPR